ncbi:MAG: LemA family protein [Propionibacteriaceae bacterium]|jgi:LemA protein|nr:LemA family protein [Propionibacteriaceae bacterium]
MVTAIVIILIILVLLVVWGIGVYNRMVSARNLVEQSWNQIDVELNRRYDLIPNLVNTIKGATGYEKSTLESVIGLRNQAAALAGAKADPAQRSAVEQELTSQLQNLVAVTVEAYPDLKANASFLQLQNELSDIEARIANARKYYNANVGSYNTLIESFPNSFVASTFGHFVKADYFQVQDPNIRANPTVDFSAAPAAPAAPVAPALPPTLPVEQTAPFQAPPAPAGEFGQPDFTQPSGVSDQK